jgi:hypothetical protein
VPSLFPHGALACVDVYPQHRHEKSFTKSLPAARKVAVDQRLLSDNQALSDRSHCGASADRLRRRAPGGRQRPLAIVLGEQRDGAAHPAALDDVEQLAGKPRRA